MIYFVFIVAYLKLVFFAEENQIWNSIYLVPF